jgi:hypothetical protein
MSVWRLIIREILYRKLGFALAVLSVIVAVGCPVAALTLLRLHDAGTERVIARKEAETRDRTARLEEDTRRRTAKLEDDYRKIALHLGFNVLILPKDQGLGELHAAGYATKAMPEDYATRLAKSGVATINHVLPVVQQKVKWPERERTIILGGTRGELPVGGRNPKKPLLERVPPGAMVVGYELHRSLKLARGDKVRLMGKAFTVSGLQPERGSADDITVWVNLAEAQKLLGLEGKINGILALECNCAADRLHRVRSEIASILPDTQVLEKQSQALTRAEARNRAAEEAKAARARAAAEARAAVDGERQARAELRRGRDALAAVLVPLAVLACVLWLGVLTLANVRERAPEIGILRALGLPSGQVFLLFLARAAAVGLAGAALGYGVGVLAGAAWGRAQDEPVAGSSLLDPGLLLLVLAAAPVLSALVAWLPALLASRQDPAVILRDA